MIGIVSFGVYLPYCRLVRRHAAEVLGERPASGEKAVARFDEDSLTLAVNAALECMAGQSEQEVDALFFATSTPPYAEKSSAATMAAALDLREDVRIADVTGTIRASSAAFLAAVDAVSAGARKALVAAGDCRLGAPQGPYDLLLGDGGAALLLGRGEEVAARVVAVHSHVQEQIGVWRNQGDRFVRAWEERFVQAVWEESVAAAVRGVLEKAGLGPADVAKLAIGAPSPRAAAGAAGRLGFAREQLQDGLWEQVGATGTAHVPMMLAAALEAARPGDRILAVTAGEGCDAVLLEVTEAIRRLPRRRGIQEQLAAKDNGLLYSQYLKWKGVLPTEPPRRPETPRPSAPAMQRNYRQNLALYGSRCLACGTPQFPRQRVCARCRTLDRMEDCRFLGRTARVATYTVDYLAASPSPPTIFAVADFEGGGRMLCEVTDCDPRELSIGMELEMTFRRLYEAGGIHNYFWKARPRR